MNEEELKELWKGGEGAPTIDLMLLRDSSNIWRDKLRRKTRIDIWAQSITTALTLVPVLFYPRMIIASLMVVILGIWYVRELRMLSQPKGTDADDISVRDLLNAKILALQSYFRRTRFVVYVLCLPIVPAAFYGAGFFDQSGVALADWAFWLLKILAIYELGVVIGTEIYFKITYTPVLNELRSLSRQLDA